MTVIIIIAIVIFCIYQVYKFLFCTPVETDSEDEIKTVNVDEQWLNKNIPGLLHSFESAMQIYKQNSGALRNYKIYPYVELVGCVEKSCYRVQIEFYNYSDSVINSYYHYWKYGMFSGKRVIYKEFPAITVYEGEQDWILDKVQRVHPEWEISGNYVFF